MQLRHIHLPRDAAIIQINASRDPEAASEGQHKTAQAGSLALSTFVGGLLVYQTRDSMLGFAFAAMLAFLVTHCVIRALGG